MKAFIRFFQTSPLSRWGIFWSLFGLGILGLFFIVGGIYGFTEGDDFSTLVFVLVGIIFIAAGIIGINPKSCARFWAETLPPDDSRFDG